MLICKFFFENIKLNFSFNKKNKFNLSFLHPEKFQKKKSLHIKIKYEIEINMKR